VDTLGARHDFLAANEEIIRIRVFLSHKTPIHSAETYRVVRIGHRVEWTDAKWELVQHEEIRLVLFLDQLAELAFILGTADCISVGSLRKHKELTLNRHSRPSRHPHRAAS
jgi:hypothetical protein